MRASSLLRQLAKGGCAARRLSWVTPGFSQSRRCKTTASKLEIQQEKQRRANAQAAANKRAATAAANKKARQDKLDAEASADKKRDQSYEDELRSLEIQKQKLALAKEEARVKRENEFIDQELKHKAAQTDVVQSEADANRNMTEGGRDLMKSVGKAEENKSDSWFN